MRSVIDLWVAQKLEPKTLRILFQINFLTFSLVSASNDGTITRVFLVLVKD